MYEDDPEDFVAIEIPSDSATADSDAPILELTELRRKSGFLDKLRRNRNLSGMTVITGSRRMRGGGGGAREDRVGGVGEGAEYGKKMALHELADEARVMQGGGEGTEEEVEKEEQAYNSYEVGIL